MSATRWALAPQQEYMLAKLAFKTANNTVRYRNPFMAIRVDGPFDVAGFVAAVDTLAGQHEILRAELDSTSASSVRLVDHLNGEHVAFVPRCADPDEELTSQEWQVFDPTRAPLWRIRVLELQPQRHVIAFTFCHLIWDGVSMRTFLDLVAREYASPGSVKTPAQYGMFVDAAIAERKQRRSRPRTPTQSQLLATIAQAALQRRARRGEVAHYDLRRVPFSIGSRGMQRCRERALAEGSSPFHAALRGYLTVASVATGRRPLIAAYAASRLDLRPSDDCLGYFSDLVLATASMHGDREPGLQALDPALSWAELTDAVGDSVTYPQDLWDVWARGPVFGSAAWAQWPPPITMTVLPLTPAWTQPVHAVKLRRLLGHQTIPSFIVDDLRDGSGYLEFNAAAVPRRTARELARLLGEYFRAPCTA